MGAGLVATVFLLYLVRDVIPPFLFAIAIAYLLYPAVVYLGSRGLGRVPSILAVYAFCGIGLYLGGTFALPRLLREIGTLAKAASSWTDAAARIARRFDVVAAGFDAHPALRRTADMVALSLENEVLRFAEGLRASLVSSLSGFAYLAVAPLLAFYLLKDADYIKSRFTSIVPKEEPLRGRVLGLVADLDRAVGGFVRGQLLVAGFVGAAVSVGTFLLGLPFPLMLGVFAGISELVPYLGPIIGAVPAVVVALGRSPWLAAKTAILFVAIQQVEAGFIGPKVIGDRVGLHPLVVIFALLVGGRLFGPFGLVLAVPAAGALKALVKFVSGIVADAGGDKPPPAPGNDAPR